MKLGRVLSLALALGLTYTVVDAKVFRPTKAELNLPVGVVLANDANAAGCVPSFKTLREHVGGKESVTWQFVNSCGNGADAVVALTDWKLEDKAGRTIEGKHPFGSDCAMRTTVPAGGTASITCKLPAQVQDGAYQYMVNLKIGKRSVKRDPILVYP